VGCIKELRLAGIGDLEAANAFLSGFMATYNSQFARPPALDRDLHRPLAGLNDLGDILCWQERDASHSNWSCMTTG
jgi:hypothetical protein